MTFAFLFLTYDNFTHPEIIWNFSKTENIYIHPKYPDRVIPKFRPFIIDSLIETKWGELSIVDATINLLRESYSVEENIWFMLLSEDSYPLHSFDTFRTKFKKSSSGDKSFFHLINTNGDLTKTSQWWILHRNDVKTIIENDSEYRKIISISKKSDGSYDEFYFLSLLRWINPNHQFIDKKVMYDDFQKGTIQRSPKIFNKFIKYDENETKINDSFFIRKVTPEFTLKTHNTKSDLIVIYIGTETKQENLRNNISKTNVDIIILSSIKVELINPEIIRKSVCVIQIIYKFHLETILSLNLGNYLNAWNSILFTTENYDISYQYLLDNLPEKNLPVIGESLFKNVKEFKHVVDKNGNLAFHKTISRRNSIKKMRIPRDKYIPNLPTFKDWESPSYDSPSPSWSNHNTPESPPFTLSESPPFTLTDGPPISADRVQSIPSPPFVPIAPMFPPPISADRVQSIPSPPFVPIEPMSPPPFIIPKCVRKDSATVPKRIIIRVKKNNSKKKSPPKDLKISPPKDLKISPSKDLDFVLPDGMTLKIMKKCPKGSKTYKYKEQMVCKQDKVQTPDKKVVVVNDSNSINMITNNNFALPNGMTLKVGKKCPKGSKTYKYKEQMVCKQDKVQTPDKKVVVVYDSNSINMITNNNFALPNGMTLKVGKKCPKGSKTHKYQNINTCKKNTTE